MVVSIGGWCHRIRGDGVDVGGSDDAHAGRPVILHAHADAYGDPRNDPHDEHDSKHDASNRSTRENIPNVGIVGTTVGCTSIAAVRSAVFATLSKAILCVDKEQDHLRKQDPRTQGQPQRGHPSWWPQAALSDRRVDLAEGGVKGQLGTPAVMWRVQCGQVDRAVLPRAGSRAILAMTPVRELRKPAGCASWAPVVLVWLSYGWGSLSRPKVLALASKRQLL